nr:MAG TPA: ATP-dependent Clp protease ATP-binding subunit [Caudoviricetes sp.]
MRLVAVHSLPRGLESPKLRCSFCLQSVHLCLRGFLGSGLRVHPL